MEMASWDPFEEALQYEVFASNSNSDDDSYEADDSDGQSFDD